MKVRKIRLKRCPFCKCKASLWKDEHDGYFYAGCLGNFCAISPWTSGQPTEQEAAETWNYRAKLKRRNSK